MGPKPETCILLRFVWARFRLTCTCQLFLRAHAYLGRLFGTFWRSEAANLHFYMVVVGSQAGIFLQYAVFKARVPGNLVKYEGSWRSEAGNPHFTRVCAREPRKIRGFMAVWSRKPSFLLGFLRACGREPRKLRGFVAA